MEAVDTVSEVQAEAQPCKAKTSPIFALLDLNNFYSSAEQSLRPSLRGKPLVVLSNNDGAVIARSNEARALGIKMAQPYFEVRHLEESAGLIALSANFELYGDLSQRVMTLAAGLGHRQEIYSIDESFIRLDGIRGDLVDRARSVRARILQWVGMPCCIGIAPTKSLAKFANFVAKQADRKPGSYPVEHAQVCDLTRLSSSQLDELLATTDVSDVWGVGRRISKQLHDQGVHTALDLKRMSPAAARSGWSVVFERTVRELQGESCLDIEDIAPDKKEIACTRSFGAPVRDIYELQEAVTEFASRASKKLRDQAGAAGQVLVFIRTSPFRKTAQYSRSVVVPMRTPSADTAAIVGAALMGLKAIFRPGFDYAKAGVILMDIAPGAREQFELDLGSEDPTPAARPKLMETLDKVNDRYGHGTLQLGTARLGTKPRNWAMKQERRTPAYTTRWEDMPVVRA